MKHILLVDDNKENISLVSSVLDGSYKVHTTNTSLQTLEFLDKNSCDLILLDIDMSQTDCFEVMSKLSGNKDSTPMIFLTADADAETKNFCFESGAAEFVLKPVVPIVLLTRVKRILEMDEMKKRLSALKQPDQRETTAFSGRSDRDQLTGLWNRAYAESAANSHLKLGGGALLLIDVDNFKAINDGYGNIAGDMMLKLFADTLRSFAAQDDVACRIDGDKFALFADGIRSLSELSRLARGIISKLCESLSDSGLDLKTSVSIGISRAPEDGASFDALFTAADKALYFVKNSGKNSFRFFSGHSNVDSGQGSSVDLGYLRDFMTGKDKNDGAYTLDLDSFHHVYDFLRRFADRGNVQTVLFTAFSPSGTDPAEIEAALEILEQSIYTLLRRVDVCTRYSSRQLMVILPDSGGESGDNTAKSIISCFDRLYTGKKVRFEYGIAKIEGMKNSN